MYLIFIQEEENIIGKAGVFMKEAKQEITNSKYTNDWLPVKQIMNGMIQLENGYYVTGVKVMPKNIFIMDSTSQNVMINSLTNFYNTLDYEFWLIVADRPVDINIYLSQLQILYNNTTNNAIKKIIMQDMNKANSFVQQEYGVVDTEYYILFKERKMDVVQKKLHTMISNLANCGLNSQQTSNNDLRMILDNLLNGGESIHFGTVEV